jgi:RNase P/RNase MRP subunit p30
MKNHIRILETLSEEDVHLEIFYMDTKRNNGEDQIADKVQEAMEKIREFSPDLVITSDDNAVMYVVSPYLDTSGIPVVFCGVNWSAEQY